jgi:hypothetical protein
MASNNVLKFCAPGLVFGGTERGESRFHVLRARIRFRRYRGRRIPFSSFARLDSFSYFARPDSFPAVPWASGPVFKFCAPGLIFGGVECVGSRFHVLRARTRFQQYRGRGVPFLCCALPDTFLAVPRLSGPVFMFCAPGLVFDGTEGVGSRFHVLRTRTRFWGRRIPFSSFAHPDSFSAVRRASNPAFMFCAPGLVFDGTEGVGSRFHVLQARTHFWRYRGRWLQFSCFARPNSFSAVWRDSRRVLMFCAPVLVFGGTEGVRFHFYVFRAWTRFWRY